MHREESPLANAEHAFVVISCRGLIESCCEPWPQRNEASLAPQNQQFGLLHDGSSSSATQMSRPFGKCWMPCDGGPPVQPPKAAQQGLTQASIDLDRGYWYRSRRTWAPDPLWSINILQATPA